MKEGRVVGDGGSAGEVIVRPAGFQPPKVRVGCVGRFDAPFVAAAGRCVRRRHPTYCTKKMNLTFGGSNTSPVKIRLSRKEN